MIKCEARIGFNADAPPCRHGAVVRMTVRGAEDLNCEERPTCSPCSIVTLSRVARWFPAASIEVLELNLGDACGTKVQAPR